MAQKGQHAIKPPYIKSRVPVVELNASVVSVTWIFDFAPSTERKNGKRDTHQNKNMFTPYTELGRFGL